MNMVINNFGPNAGTWTINNIDSMSILGRKQQNLDTKTHMSKREKLNNVRVVNKQNLSKILKSNIHSHQAMEGILSQIKQEDQ